MRLPSSTKELIPVAQELIQATKASEGIRSAAYKQYAQWIETGRQAGGLALANMLYQHVDRLHSHLFSPSDLRFSIDYENHYGDRELAMAKMGGRVLSREWERRNIDAVFASGVRESLVYGACPIKLLANGDGKTDAKLTARLVMPWFFGVENEAVADIDQQEAVRETAYLTKAEVWRRVKHLPDAEKLFTRIIHGADRTEGVGSPTSFFHQVLSTMALDTSANSPTSPGGLVSLTNGVNYGVMGPQIGIDVFPMHELWVKDDDLNDYVMIQLFEPDILIAPLFARKNPLAPGIMPYRMIRPNDTANYFWGRSELVDLMMLQQLMTTTLDDMRRIMGNQFDKLLAFSGDGLSDETYGQFRAQGYINLGPNGNVTDLTPKMPPEAFTFLELLSGLMDKIGGFSNVLSGQGETGVRAGTHAEMLLRQASPRLRDRSLMVERQCAGFADITLAVMQAKNARAYWTDEDKSPDGEFLLAQIPADRRVSVDSHSASPVYQEDHLQQIAFGAKIGAIGGDTFIEQSTLPNKDILVARFHKMQEERAKAAAAEKQAEFTDTAIKHPEGLAALNGQPQAIAAE